VWSDDRPGDARVNRDTLLKFPHQTDLFVPIAVKNRPIGGFFVIWWTERRVITDGELRLLEGISELAGIFLENAELYRDAASANRAKDEFLATLSHELRNPLGAIVNGLAALERRGAPDEVTNRLRQIIQRQADHLGRLVDDLLDVARATAGKILLNCQPLDLSELVGGCVRVLRTSGRASQHSVTLRAESLLVNADVTRLAQIVANMLDNAVKFTPSGGSVDIDVQREGEEALLRVTDNGIGIAPEMLSRVFELFAQGDQPMDRPAGGLGIGLTLSRRLVELHGGTITVESEGRGRGAQFTVRLPIERVAAPAPPPAAPAPERRRSVLIVEDSDDAREALRLLLESLGHRVFEASDGQQGLTLALQHRPEVVLIDLGLPGLDGYEMAQALRSTPEGRTAALIAVTGYGQQDDRRRSKEAGFDAHLVKPVSLSLLSSLISAGARE
jgi:signal transduction histidine kinase